VTNLPLSFAFGENSRSRPLIDGRISPEGIDLHPTRSGMQELAWRQFHGHEFHVSELSMSSLIAAHSRGDRSFIGIPVFTTRGFMQTAILVRDGASIDSPEKLAGKRIGVPEYQQTAALWARGIMHHDFGVDPTSCHWYMERLPEQSHGGSTGFQPQDDLDFQYIPWEQNIDQMLRAGELDASLLGGPWGSAPSNVRGRTRKTIVNANRGSVRYGPGTGVSRLFADPAAEGARYFQKTGIYPVNHGVVIRSDVLEQYPWVALNIYQAFLEAKDLWIADMVEGERAYLDTGSIDARAFERLQTDLYPYGVRANKHMLETLIQYSFEQGLSDRQVSIEEIFYGPTLEL
jgi:4,5-dihydroxyphthalate decarboxylase